jgi:hypothetical protein
LHFFFFSRLPPPLIRLPATYRFSALATRLLKLTTLEVVAIEDMLREIGLTKMDGRGELRMKISGFMNFFGGGRFERVRVVWCL